MNVESTQNASLASKAKAGLGSISKKATEHPILTSLFLGGPGLIASGIANNAINGKASEDGVSSESKSIFEKGAEKVKDHPILSSLLLGPIGLLGANLIDNAANKKHEQNGEVQNNTLEYDA